MPTQAQVARASVQNRIQLYEDDRQRHLELRPLASTLPAASGAQTAFDNNPSFAKARREKKPVVAFQSVTGKSILIVPTKPYASICDFARRASPQEWRQLWLFVYRVRQWLQSKFGGHFYISTIGTDVPQLHVRLERRPNVTYYLNLDAVATPDRRLILKYANEAGGWTSRFQCRVAQGTTDHTSDAQVFFSSPDQLAATFGPDFRDLSVTSMDTRLRPTTVPSIHFNLRNWNTVPKDFKGTLTTYRKYVIQHELGHALFHITTHDEEPSSGACPVMMQQTRGTRTCAPGIKHHPHSWTLPKKSARLDAWLYDLPCV